MKRLLFVAALLTSFAACSKNPSPQEETETRKDPEEETQPQPEPEPEPEPTEVDYTIMTYNVGSFRKYESTLGHLSYPEVASVISSVDADICGLNETDYGYARTYKDLQADKLAKELGEGWSSRFVYAYLVNYGNSMVWKDKLGMIFKWPRVNIPKTGEGEVRSMGAVEFEDFVFCVTHLDHKSDFDRLEGVKIITAWVQQNYPQAEKPIILAGDLNCQIGSNPINELQKNWIQLSPVAKSYPSSAPKSAIDYILVYANDQAERVTVKDGGVITKEDNPTIADASDHCPIWVKVTIKK